MIDDQGRSHSPKETILSSDLNSDDKNYEPKPSSLSRRGRGGLNRTYGLRPRTGIKRPLIDDDLADIGFPVERKRNRGGGAGAGVSNLGGTGAGQPLSKYRRKTANARERLRMKEINNAFSTLRGVLPAVSQRRTAITSMTKIRTLRLAVSYIQALSDILNDEENDQNVPKTVNNSSEQSNCSSISNVITKQENPSEYVPNLQNMYNPHPNIMYNTNNFTSEYQCTVQPHNSSFMQKPYQNNCVVNQPKPIKLDCVENNNTETDYFGLFNGTECNTFEEPLPVWEEMPSLTDFCWSLS